jgi:hypothetical protein
MLIVHHRRNTLDLLALSSPSWGVEIDVRSYGDKLVVHHDPFADALTLEDWLLRRSPIAAHGPKSNSEFLFSRSVFSFST